MSQRLRPNPFFDQLEAEHRTWLAEFDPRHLRKWEIVLGGDEEAAFAEARVRQLLQSYGVAVEPNEDVSGGSPAPDFRCFSLGSKFYVEVTCIPIDIATAETGIPNGSHGDINCRPLTDAIFAKCRRKASQCATLDAPALVAIGTFHNHAASSSFRKPLIGWLLTGETKIAWNIEVNTGQMVGDAYEITELQSAAFLRPDKAQEVGYARSSISGLLLCGLTLVRHQMMGVLHPNPARPFHPANLPQVEFGQLTIDRSTRQLHVTWPQGNDE